MKKNPFLIIGLTFAFSQFLNFIFDMTISWCVLISLISLVVIFKLIKKISIREVILFVLLPFLISNVNCSLYYSVINQSKYCENKSGTVECVVKSDAIKSNDKFYYIVHCKSFQEGDCEKIDVNFNSKMYASEKLYISPYDTIKINLTFFSNESSSTKAYNYSNNTILSSYTKGDYDFTQFNGSKVEYFTNKIGYYITSLQSYFIKQVDNTFLANTSTFVRAILFGDKSELSQEFLYESKAIGILHILAVSGMHLNFLTVMFYNFLTLCKVEKKYSQIVTVVFILFYMLLCGFSNSISRAGVMSIALIISDLNYCKMSKLNALGIALTVICLFNSCAILSVGLQLSFLTTLGIVFSQSNYHKEFLAKKKSAFLSKVNIVPLVSYTHFKRTKRCIVAIVKFLYQTVSISFFASLFALPVIITVYGRFSQTAFLSNLLLGLPAQFIICFSMIILLLSMCPLLLPILTPIIFMCESVIKAFMIVIDMLFGLDFGFFDLSNIVYSIGIIVVVFLVLKTLLIKKVTFLKYKILVRKCVVIMLACVIFNACFSLNAVTLSLYDVGNGLCTVISQKESAIIFLEKCKSNKVFDIYCFLKDNNIKKVDAVILCDNSTSTQESAKQLQKNIEVDCVITTQQNYNDDLCNNFNNTIKVINNNNILTYGKNIALQSYSTDDVTIFGINIKDKIVVMSTGKGNSDIYTKLPEIDLFITSHNSQVVVDSDMTLVSTNNNDDLKKYINSSDFIFSTKDNYVMQFKFNINRVDY